MPRPLIAGIDVGGTNTRVALASPSAPGRILVRRQAPTPGPGVQPVLALLERTLLSCLREVGPGMLQAIGCAVPGMTDQRQGIVLEAANLPGWDNIPLAHMLAQQLGVAAQVENDVNAAALAEATCGAGTGCRLVVFMTVSTGVAAGIVVDGQLLRGAHHSAGEIANIIPDPAHLERSWRPNGCLESTAAGMGLAAEWAAATGTTLDAKEIFAAAAAGHADALRLVRRAADYLAQAAVAIGSIIDPERLIVGGSIGLSQARVFDRIRSAVRSALPFPPRVVRAALRHDAPLIGMLLAAARIAGR